MFVLGYVFVGEVVRVELHQGQPKGGLMLVGAKFKVQAEEREREIHKYIQLCTCTSTNNVCSGKYLYTLHALCVG